MGRELARTSLQSILVKSGRCSAPKLAVLDRALDLQAKSGGGGLERLLAILSDPPNQLLEGYAKADKLVQEWADSLRAEMQMNRLLSDTGAAFDPGLLFGAGSSKTRISVVNLIGLPELDSQRTFVDQLAQNLFGWVKKNPAPSGSVRGLLVIDEAKDFVPSGRAVPSSGSLKRLAAQARKYGLGLVFATQEPRVSITTSSLTQKRSYSESRIHRLASRLSRPSCGTAAAAVMISPSSLPESSMPIRRASAAL